MTIAVYGKASASAGYEGLGILFSHLRDKCVKIAVYRPFHNVLPVVARKALGDAILFDNASQIPQDASLCLSIGGDGTFLSSVVSLAGMNLPVAGINYGRLGFLTTARASEGLDFVDDLLAGNFTVTHRTLLQASSDSFGEGFFPIALNEASIHRDGAGMISVDVAIDGRALPTYWADGLLVATATGSTAYSLSVGGPVVTPGCKVLIIAPIAPHNLNVRPLVVPEDSVITLKVHSRSGRYNFMMDNRLQSMPAEAEITVRRAPQTLDTVSLRTSNFIAALNEKLLWGEDKRNKL